MNRPSISLIFDLQLFHGYLAIYAAEGGSLLTTFLRYDGCSSTTLNPTPHSPTSLWLRASILPPQSIDRFLAHLA
ncbi:hypothetical protein AcV7_003698 [Taiwanofungus camphoratus]|nr:hypothetical protein AcV7_003698 [Antrodia cinnamomea]